VRLLSATCLSGVLFSRFAQGVLVPVFAVRGWAVDGEPSGSLPSNRQSRPHRDARRRGAWGPENRPVLSQDRSKASRYEVSLDGASTRRRHHPRSDAPDRAPVCVGRYRARCAPASGRAIHATALPHRRARGGFPQLPALKLKEWAKRERLGPESVARRFRKGAIVSSLLRLCQGGTR
jgi:hypothetical protein